MKSYKKVLTKNKNNTSSIFLFTVTLIQLSV